MKGNSIISCLKTGESHIVRSWEISTVTERMLSQEKVTLQAHLTARLEEYIELIKLSDTEIW